VWHCYKLAGVSGIEATANYPDFDRVNVNVSDRVYGITAEISSYKDFSNTIVQRVADFDQLIGDIMARNIIELIIYNRRSNQGQRITEEKGQMIYTDLNQEQASEQSPYTTGLKASIRKEIKRLKQTFYPKQTITVSVPHC
jgi:hypothetical protein